MNKFYVKTEKVEEGFVSKIEYGDKILKSPPKPMATQAISIIINAVVAKEAEQNRLRNVDYIFKIK